MAEVAERAVVVSRNDKAEGVDMERAKNSVNVLSTREWTDRNGVKHPAAPTQAKQPVSISYSVLDKSDGTQVELITVNFKTTGVRIRGFSGEFAHLLKPIKAGSKVGKIFATELSYDARSQRFSADEVEVTEEEPEFEDKEASA